MYHFTIVLRQKCSKQIWAWVTLNLSDSQRVQRLLDNHISVIQLQLIKCRANPHSTLMYGLVTGTSPNIILDLDRFALRLLCNFARLLLASVELWWPMTACGKIQEQNPLTWLQIQPRSTKWMEESCGGADRWLKVTTCLSLLLYTFLLFYLKL